MLNEIMSKLLLSLQFLHFIHLCQLQNGSVYYFGDIIGRLPFWHFIRVLLIRDESLVARPKNDHSRRPKTLEKPMCKGALYVIISSPLFVCYFTSMKISDLGLQPGRSIFIFVFVNKNKIYQYS